MIATKRRENSRKIGCETNQYEYSIASGGKHTEPSRLFRRVELHKVWEFASAVHLPAACAEFEPEQSRRLGKEIRRRPGVFVQLRSILQLFCHWDWPFHPKRCSAGRHPAFVVKSFWRRQVLGHRPHRLAARCPVAQPAGHRALLRGLAASEQMLDLQGLLPGIFCIESGNGPAGVCWAVREAVTLWLAHFVGNFVFPFPFFNLKTGFYTERQR